MNICRIGNVELTESQVRDIYESDRYIVTYSRVYQVFYSQAQCRFYGVELYRQPGMARRGRFHIMTAAAVNHLLGFDLVR